MTRNRDVEQSLQRLLKERRIPLDEARLDAMRRDLQRRAAAGPVRRHSGFLRRHRFALSSGTALVLAFFAVWRFAPFGPKPLPPTAPGKLVEIAADENRMDRALVLLGGFASPSSAGETMVDWDLFNRSMLGDYQEENILETLYSSL